MNRDTDESVGAQLTAICRLEFAFAASAKSSHYIAQPRCAQEEQ